MTFAALRPLAPYGLALLLVVALWRAHEWDAATRAREAAEAARLACLQEWLAADAAADGYAKGTADGIRRQMEAVRPDLDSVDQRLRERSFFVAPASGAAGDCLSAD